MRELIVAIFDVEARAHYAMDSLGAVGVPQASMRLYGRDDPEITAWIAANPSQAADVGGSASSRGFWASLFGEDSLTRDHHVFERSLRGGSAVLAVDADDQVASRVMRLLECHLPADIGERAASLGLAAQEPAADRAAQETQPEAGDGRAGSAVVDATGEGARELEGSLPSTFADHGTTRVRHYIVRTPVQVPPQEPVRAAVPREPGLAHA